MIVRRRPSASTPAATSAPDDHGGIMTRAISSLSTFGLSRAASALLLLSTGAGCGATPEPEPADDTDATARPAWVSDHIYEVERCIGCGDHTVSLTQNFYPQNPGVKEIKTTVIVSLTVGHVDQDKMWVSRVTFDYYLWSGDGTRGPLWFWDGAGHHHFPEPNGIYEQAMPLWKTYAYEGVYSVTPSGTYTVEIHDWVHGHDGGPPELWLQNNVTEVISNWGGSGSIVDMLFIAEDVLDKGGSGSTGGSSPPPLDPGCGAAILGAGAVLGRGESVASCNGRVVLIHQTDGNVVLLHDGTPRWHSVTYGHESEALVMQGDGNLVLYAPGGVPLWASGTHGHEGAFAAVQEDCNFVVYTAASVPVWASGSSCY
jgi:hypothetical protein